MKPSADVLQKMKELNDSMIEGLWDNFEDVPMDPETECIEEEFANWPKGTDRETIWHWFDRMHSKGVHYLLYERNTQK